MTTRDRIFLTVVIAAAMLVGVYILAVSPERKRASALGKQVAAAQKQVQTAQSTRAAALAAQSKYPEAYATVVRLGKAVPPSAQEPSLVYQLDHLANAKGTNLLQLDSSTAASPAVTAAASPAAATGAAAFTSKIYTLQFTGSFFDLYHVFNSLNAFTLDQGSGQLDVSGRLLTINSASLTATTPGQLTGAISITAYYVPPAQGVTAGATPAGPAAGATAQPASASPAPAATPAPAVVKATR
jgi:hypothetical protein